ncbi:cell wall-binding repeat-containing protein [Candidatus Poriferisodalis sp.]|uniref:cell wall-binding repeat-containing protein n=1 Tax=Candidatus Poriferisodalis sp. TaxID=3101277 RepID=UPI003B59DCFC
MRRALTGAVLVVAVVGGVLGLPTSAAAQTAQEEQLAKVAVARYGGADRYATSLLVAEAVAADAGGSLSHVVMVSGLNWPDAVVAAPVAGALGAPVLMTPPGELRDDAAAFVQRTGASDVVVVGSTGDAHAVSEAVVASLADLGLSVKRVGGADRYRTGVAAARHLSSVGDIPGLGRTAIVANGWVFADALVAGSFAARGRHPVLLTPPGELNADVAAYLSEAGIEHVVLMGGTGALAESVDWSISQSGIAVTRLAGATRFDTAVKAADFVVGRYASGTERCFSTERIGLARARVPFDSFSAGPLLGRLCAPLLLADPNAIPLDTAGFLDAARTATAAAGADALDLRVFGGDAAVSQAAIDAYLSGESAVEPEAEPTELPAGTCGGQIDAAPVQLIAEDFPEKPAWSPDCSQIVYGARWRLWIANRDGSEPSELTERDDGFFYEPAWSPNGTRIAYARQVNQQTHWESHIWVVNADGTAKAQITRGDVWDDDPSWSPDGTKLVFTRLSGTGRNAEGHRIEPDRYIVTMNADGTDERFLAVGGTWERAPRWSPDGSQIAYVAGSSVWVSSTDGSGGRAVAGNAHWDGGLSWSPDGTKLAFTRVDGTDASIRLVQIDTASEEVLADVPGRESYPQWSPDGQRILFYVSTEEGTRQVWVAGASGRQVGIAPGQFVGRGLAPSVGGCGGTSSDALRQLGPLGGDGPSWSPNCTHVVFVRDRSLWLMRNDGTDLRWLATYDSHISGPSWSPDGTRIAFSRLLYENERRMSHIWVVNADGTGHTQLTRGDMRDSDPSWSPDGSKLTFSRYWGSGRDENGHRTDSDRYIVVMGLDGSGRRALTAGGAHDRSPEWSPDGTLIAYIAGQYVWVVTPDGSHRRGIAGGVSGRGLSWSPDGSRIAVVRDDDGAAALHLIELASLSDIKIEGVTGQPSSPHWSPDGQRLAFQAVDADRQTHIWVAGASGTQVGTVMGQFVGGGAAPAAGGCGGTSSDGPVELTEMAHAASEPAWSPDCTHVAFVRDRSLWLMRNDGSGLRPLTRFDGEYASGPSWSPDGSRIAYARSVTYDQPTQSQSHIWVVNTDGTQRTQLTQGDVRDIAPTWSPDSSRIAFERWMRDESDADGHSGDSYIMLMDADGSDHTKLTTGDDPEYKPAWSPDGSLIAYLSAGAVWVTAPDDFNPRVVAAGALAAGGLSWSPDGTRIAYARGSWSESHVVAVEVDGLSEDVIGHGLLKQRNPRWSPDGERIAYDGVAAPTDADVDRSRVGNIWRVGVSGAAGTPVPDGARECRPRGRSDGTTAGFPLPDRGVPSTGVVRVAVLFMDFSDAQAEHTTQEEAELGLPWAETFLETASYGKIDIEFVPLHRWLRAEQDSTAYIGRLAVGMGLSSPTSAHAVAMADDEFDFSTVDLVLTVFPGSHFAGGNAGGSAAADDVEVSTTRVNTHRRAESGSLTAWGYVGAHEMTHNLGLLDMYPYDPERGKPPEVASDNVLVFIDIGLMGLASTFATVQNDERLRHIWTFSNGSTSVGYTRGLNLREMLGWSRWQLGWLSDSQVSCSDAPDTTVQLAPIAQPGDGVAMAAVPLTTHEMIVIESRRKSGYDADRPFEEDDARASTTFPRLITEGVLVYVVDSAIGSGELPIRVAGDDGNRHLDDFPVLEVGESVTLRGYTITVTADDGDTHTVVITRNS